MSLEIIWCQSTGSIMIAEVDSEEEAFAEMRRFLKVNKIPSDSTSFSIVAEHEYLGKIIPTYKKVWMFQCGYIVSNSTQKFPNPCFGIYYGNDKPRGGTLKRMEDYDLTIKKDYYGKTVVDENGLPVLVNDYYPEGNKWYMPIFVYLQNVWESKKGG